MLGDVDFVYVENCPDLVLDLGLVPASASVSHLHLVNLTNLRLEAAPGALDTLASLLIFRSSVVGSVQIRQTRTNVYLEDSVFMGSFSSYSYSSVGSDNSLYIR